MKLKVIGSGNITSKSNSASYLLDDTILIDAPNGICKALKNMNIEISKIRDILITHFHGDHFFDIPFILIDKLPYKGEFTNLYFNELDEEKIYMITKLAFKNKAKLIGDYFKYVYNSNFRIDKYEIERIKVNHSSYIECYGYIFKEDNKYIGFTGDTYLGDNVFKMASVCQHLICECNDKEFVGKKSHMCIDDIKQLAIKFPNCTFYTTHMADITRENLNKLNVKNIIVLKDGDEFIF